MSYAQWVKCDRCDGEGKVIDYCARDIVFGTDDVPDHTILVECPDCRGKGQVMENPKEGGDEQQS